MNITANQKSALRMIASGYRPRQVTIQALFDRGLVRGSLMRPELTRAGRQIVEKGEIVDGDTPCDLCHVLWPEDALEEIATGERACPDCLRK